MSNSKTPLVDRFGPDAADVEFGDDAPSVLNQLAARGSVRKFRPDAVPYPTLRRLCALALCAPTKSDLQQRDIIIVDAPDLKSRDHRVADGRAAGPEVDGGHSEPSHLLRQQPEATPDPRVARKAFRQRSPRRLLQRRRRRGDRPVRVRDRGGSRRSRRLSDQRGAQSLRQVVAAPETARSCFPGRRPCRGISGRGAENQHAAAAVGDGAS